MLTKSINHFSHKINITLFIQYTLCPANTWRKNTHTRQNIVRGIAMNRNRMRIVNVRPRRNENEWRRAKQMHKGNVRRTKQFLPVGLPFWHFSTYPLPAERGTRGDDWATGELGERSGLRTIHNIPTECPRNLK